MARRANNAAAARAIALDDDNAPTQRNLLPWKEMEKLLAAKLAAKAARGELPQEFRREDEIPAPPDSGVRASVRTRVDPDHDDDPHRELSYSVYTVSELDDLAVSRNEPKPEPLLQAPAPTTLRDVARAAGLVLGAFGLWARTAKPRPRVLDVCGVPLAAFRADLSRALKALPWKTIGRFAAAGAVACVMFLVAVVSIAELTDDLKPVKRATAESGARAAAEPEPATIELDDDTSAAASEPAATPATASVAFAPKARVAHPYRPKAKKPKHDLFNP